MKLQINKCILRVLAWLLPCAAVAAFVCFICLRTDSVQAWPSVDEAAQSERLRGNLDVATDRTKSTEYKKIERHAEQMESVDLESNAVPRVVLPPRLNAVLGTGNDLLDVPKRISLLEAQGNLSDAELAAIYTYLGQEENFSGLQDGHWLWLKNDLMTYMRKHDPDKDRHLQELEDLFVHHTDSVVRDYALQHLTILALDGEYGERVRGILKQGTSVKEGTIAGTALLAFSRLEGQEQGGREWLVSAASNVLNENGYNSGSRASALQVLAKFDEQAAEAMARQNITKENLSPIERISAVAVLGLSEKNINTLKMLSTDADPRVRRAARSAIIKLETL